MSDSTPDADVARLEAALKQTYPAVCPMTRQLMLAIAFWTFAHGLEPKIAEALHVLINRLSACDAEDEHQHEAGHA